MGHSSTLFDEFRSPVHVLCGRVLLVALIPGLIGVASEHWLKQARSASPPSPPAVWHPGEGARDDGLGGGVWFSDGQVITIWHLGLWKVCSNFSRCASLPSDKFPDAYGPVRGLGVISLCLHVLSVIVGLVCSCEDPENLLGINVYVPHMEEILALLAGVLMGGALVIFSQTTQQHPVYHTFHQDWSFWFLVVYVCLLLLAGGVIVLVHLHCACACRKSLCRRRRQQTTRSFQSLNRMPVAKIDFNQSVKGRSNSTQPLQETKFRFSVESFDDTTGFMCFDGQPTDLGAGKSGLEVKTGPAFVYRSLEGIPRMLRLSEKSDETDLV